MYDKIDTQKEVFALKSYSEIMRGLREDRDLKQCDIANILGIRQQQYSSYEIGETVLPIRLLTALSDFYGVSTDYILGRKDVLSEVPGLDRIIAEGHTVESVITDILSLSASGRAYVLESIVLQKVKEDCTMRKQETADVFIPSSVWAEGRATQIAGARTP
jgi:transcriptional regulator with XRE-family HTH domain